MRRQHAAFCYALIALLGACHGQTTRDAYSTACPDRSRVDFQQPLWHEEAYGVRSNDACVASCTSSCVGTIYYAGDIGAHDNAIKSKRTMPRDSECYTLYAEPLVNDRNNYQVDHFECNNAEFGPATITWLSQTTIYDVNEDVAREPTPEPILGPSRVQSQWAILDPDQSAPKQEYRARRISKKRRLPPGGADDGLLSARALSE